MEYVLFVYISFCVLLLCVHNHDIKSLKNKIEHLEKLRQLDKSYIEDLHKRIEEL